MIPSRENSYAAFHLFSVLDSIIFILESLKREFLSLGKLYFSLPREKFLTSKSKHILKLIWFKTKKELAT